MTNSETVNTAENLQSRYKKISTEFNELLAVQDEFLPKIKPFSEKLNELYERCIRLQREKYNLESNLRQVIEDAKKSNSDLNKTLQKYENIPQQFNVVRRVHDFKFAESFNLAPLATGDDYSPNNGQIEQYNSNTLHFTPSNNSILTDLISFDDVSFVTFYDKFFDKIKFKKENHTNNNIEDEISSTTNWKVYIDDKSYLDVKLVRLKADAWFEVAWDKNIKPEEINIANALLFSVITLKINTYYQDLDGTKYEIKKSLSCQLLKPEIITIIPQELKTTNKSKLQPRQKIAVLDLHDFDFMKDNSVLRAWFIKELTDAGEIAATNFNGDANFESAADDNNSVTDKINDTPKLPQIILTANAKELQQKNITNSDCTISLIKDDVELILFKNKMQLFHNP
ncbi:MAG: hypothetical protein LBP59_17430 [Planctomycetaceae bacterium]|jgi:hypothetical protein|nr:hypothetical protein [Planctomycetaceae bacterium]